MEERESAGYKHRLVLVNREEATLEGVLHLESFDDQEVVVESELGMMAIRGENLHIRQLNLETGDLAIEGLIKSIDYMEDSGFSGFKGRGKGLLGRLLR